MAAGSVLSMAAGIIGSLRRVSFSTELCSCDISYYVQFVIEFYPLSTSTSIYADYALSALDAYAGALSCSLIVAHPAEANSNQTVLTGYNDPKNRH
jgi:hypothetical protein